MWKTLVEKCSAHEIFEMALVEHCFCCSVQIASGFFAAYLLIAYLIAFAFELIWILESEIVLPAAALLLCAGYFTMALFAAFSIHGLATKNSLCLIAWMFAVIVLTFPEAGMVIYMSIQYWRIQSLYGVTEIACWFIRIVVNIVEIVLIQSLYSMWKDEELVEKRMRDLTTAFSIPIPTENLGTLNSHMYQNNGYEQSLDQLDTDLRRYGSAPHLWPNNMIPVSFEGYQYCTTPSEFNASIFVPNFVHNDTAASLAGKKAQSMMDLHILDDQPVTSDPPNHQRNPYPQSSSETNSAIIPNYRFTNNKNTSQAGMKKFASYDGLNEVGGGSSHIIKNRTGFYAQPVENYGVPIYYGPLDGPDFIIYKKQTEDKLASKNSLDNNSVDDMQK